MSPTSQAMLRDMPVINHAFVNTVIETTIQDSWQDGIRDATILIANSFNWYIAYFTFVDKGCDEVWLSVSREGGCCDPSCTDNSVKAGYLRIGMRYVSSTDNAL
jgi:hypothetical protein